MENRREQPHAYLRSVVLFVFMILGFVWLAPLVMAEEGITPCGQKLAGYYDSLDVEHLWLANERVEWMTGQTIPGSHKGSHCSTFVAAVCRRMGIYILRPPDHPQKLLADAQIKWLRDEGAAQGWRPVDSPFEAQRLANDGYVVVVAFGNPDPEKPGHIAFVRPSDRSKTAIEKEGPLIIQAGMNNYSSCSVKEGFRHHPGAWNSSADFRVSFFANKQYDMR